MEPAPEVGADDEWHADGQSIATRGRIRAHPERAIFSTH